MASMERITAPLTTPVKRIGFVILVIGTALTLVGMIQVGSDLYSYKWFEKYMGRLGDALVFDRYSYRRYPLASIGPYVFIAGLLLSYLYDRTVGPLLRWIHRG